MPLAGCQTRIDGDLLRGPAPGAAAAQIAWEFDHQRRADVVLFWFPDSGPVVQPIVLYELGAHAAGGNPIAVGRDPGYARRIDVVLQLGRIRPEVVVRDDLAAVCADAGLLATGRIPGDKGRV